MQWFNWILNCFKRKLIALNSTEVLPRCHTFVKLHQKNQNNVLHFVSFKVQFFFHILLMLFLESDWLQSSATCLLLEMPISELWSHVDISVLLKILLALDFQISWIFYCQRFHQKKCQEKSIFSIFSSFSGINNDNDNEISK